MFKDAIINALKTKHQRFGLSKEALDRIATALEKTVTKVEDIDGIVADANTMDLIAQELIKVRDQEIQKRTDTQNAFDKYKTEHPEVDPNKPQDPPTPPQGQVTLESIKQLMDEAVEKATKPLQEKIDSLEGARSSEQAIATAKERFFAGDYAKKYSTEANDAWEHALEINEVTGNKMTADQLIEKVNGYFNKSVAKLGVDTSKPFVADPPSNEEEGVTDWSEEVNRQKAAGKIPSDTQ